MNASVAVDYTLANEPAKAVEVMQELIKARAKELIARRFYGYEEPTVEVGGEEQTGGQDS
jgi:hypothetical protein